VIAGVVSFMLLCWGGGWFLRDWLVCHLLLILRNFLFSAGSWSASRVSLRVRRLGAFGFLWEREQVCEM